MIIIKDKKDSIAKIKQMGLNSFPQEVFEVGDLKGIKKFVDKYPNESFIMRSANKAKGDFFFVDNYDEAIEKLSHFEEEVTISVSMTPYKEDIVLLGDIVVKRDGGSEIVDMTARDDENATHRNIYQNPKYNFHTSIEDDRLWDISGFGKLIRYIADHELYNMIIEFVVYDCKVGINKENVVICEIRTGY